MKHSVDGCVKASVFSVGGSGSTVSAAQTSHFRADHVNTKHTTLLCCVLICYDVMMLLHRSNETKLNKEIAKLFDN